MNRNIPSKMTTSRYNAPWINSEIKRQIGKRHRVYNRARKSGNPTHWSNFRHHRAKTQKAIKSAYWKYIADIISDPPSDDPGARPPPNKRFWTYIKGMCQDQQGVSPLKEDGKLNTDSKMKADILNRQFQSVFTNERLDTMPNKGPSPHPVMPDIIVTAPGVHRQLSSLNVHKATGPDGLSAHILKETAEISAEILTTIYNKSLKSGEVPRDWRNAHVVPLFKKGERYTPSNYRPVSLTCICCKVLEHILVSNRANHLENNNILSENQHGFRRKRGTESQLILTSHDLLKSLDQSIQTDVIIMDFAKAFDKVPHQRLVHKMEYYGIGSSTTKWIHNFLSSRSQEVVLDGERSETAEVTSGVPQGTVLGPVLFLIFINDLPDNLNNKARLFADDCVLYTEIHSASDCQLLQADLHTLQQWEDQWQMSFNASKCHILRVHHKKQPIIFDYTLQGQVLSTMTDYPYLGVTISSDGYWKKHIDSICGKANKTLGFVKRNLKSAPPKLKETAYKSMVRPKLEYATTVWDPHHKYLAHNLEMVQRRSARWVCHNYSREASVTSMLDTLGWKPLQHRRTIARMTMIYKITNCLIAIPIAEYLTPVRRQTRHTHLHSYLQYQCNTEFFRYAFFPRSVVQWNSLPVDVVSAPSLEAFKAALQKQDLSTLQH
jgi:hypothetical protein